MSSSDALVFPSWKWIWNFLGGSLACLLLQKMQMAPQCSRRSWDCPGWCLLALFRPQQDTLGNNTVHLGCGAHQFFSRSWLYWKQFTPGALPSPLHLWDERDNDGNGYKVLSCSKRKGGKTGLHPSERTDHFQQEGEGKEFGLVAMKSPGVVIWIRHFCCQSLDNLMCCYTAHDLDLSLSRYATVQGKITGGSVLRQQIIYNLFLMWELLHQWFHGQKYILKG